METAPERRDDDRFEEVLGRLDALVRRGQIDDERLPPPPVATENVIPVLTEVFVPGHTVNSEAIPVLTETLSQEPEVQLDAMLPLMVRVIEESLIQQIQPALEEALKSKIAELRPQLDLLLRRQMQPGIVPEENQTEE